MGIFSSLRGKSKKKDATSDEKAVKKSSKSSKKKTEPVSSGEVTAPKTEEKTASVVNTTDATTANLDDQVVAELSIHVATCSKSRSKATLQEMINGESGHSWLELKMIDENNYDGTHGLNADLANAASPHARDILKTQYGQTSIGFYPKTFWFADKIEKDAKEEVKREVHARNQARIAKHEAKGHLDAREAAGFGLGRGYSRDEHDKYGGMFSKMNGTVEEPDDIGNSTGCKVFRITGKQFKALYAYVLSHYNHHYHYLTYNCTTFASHALKAAGHSIGAERVPGICEPQRLYRSLYDEAKKDAKAGRESDVTLTRLGANESHGEHKAGKIGPDGDKVRVAGADATPQVQMVISKDLILASIAKLPADQQADINLLKDKFKDSFVTAMMYGTSMDNTIENALQYNPLATYALVLCLDELSDPGTKMFCRKDNQDRVINQLAYLHGAGLIDFSTAYCYRPPTREDAAAAAKNQSEQNIQSMAKTLFESFQDLFTMMGNEEIFGQLAKGLYDSMAPKKNDPDMLKALSLAMKQLADFILSNDEDGHIANGYFIYNDIYRPLEDSLMALEDHPIKDAIMDLVATVKSAKMAKKAAK